MRFIDLEGQKPAKAWLERAEALTKSLNDAQTKAERDAIIDANSSVWGELKDWLGQFSKQKCWFSEARDTYSHRDIEHFRPKKIARNFDGSEREGYWWLAFDWQNFRLCGNVGNRKKGGYFPLRAGTHQATFADRNIDDEVPYLLDPTRPEDPLLFSFDEDGDVTPLADLDDWSKARVEESIKRYKLREHELLKEARRDVWTKCIREVNLCQNLMKKMDVQPSASKREAVRQQMMKLREMLKSEAEFSSTAAECLRTRPEQWAQRLAAASATM